MSDFFEIGDNDEKATEEFGYANRDSSPAADEAREAEVGVSDREERNEEVGSAEATVAEVRDNGNERPQTNALGPLDQFTVIEQTETYDVIVHPYVEGATARLHYSNGAIRADGSCGQHPGTVIVPADEANNPNFYALKIDSSERGAELVTKRWEKHRSAIRRGVEAGVAKSRGIPKQQMNSEVATEVISEHLTHRVLDRKEPLREVTNTTKFLMQSGDMVPHGQRKADAPDVAIQINITDGLISESFKDDDDSD